MAEQTITITIDDNGKIKAETNGIKGDLCLVELQELLENENNLLDVEKTDEYYQQKNVRVQNKIERKIK